MNRRHNILILASILCVILAVTAMFVLQRRNRSVIYRIESTIVEQNEMLRKQAERQRLLYATLFLDPKLAETGRNTIFLRLHDDMCFNCYAPTTWQGVTYMQKMRPEEVYRCQEDKECYIITDEI